jgi:hypothetical protein
LRPLRTTWKSTPGNFDPLHTQAPSWSENCWGIPEVRGTTEPLAPQWSLTFDALRTEVRRKRSLPAGQGVVTFFTEDYRFEQLWTSPDRFLTYMDTGNWALTPDFSLYTDWPPAVHLWQIYRSRWLGQYWQDKGLKVIPTVSWASPSSYEYCFLGLPRHSVLAVSTIGVLKHQDTRTLWEAGFRHMVETLSPIQVLCCGALPSGFDPGVSVTHLVPFHAKFSNSVSQREQG